MSEFNEIQEVMSRLNSQAQRKMILQQKALEKHGEEGLDLAIDILMDNPEISEQDFWTELEAQIKA